MIAYLKGEILKKEDDRLILLTHQIGYEVVVPHIVMETLGDKKNGEDVALYIYYYQTERQPKPILIGFIHEKEKEFFQHFISVDAIGPLKAIKALTVPIQKVAHAIETEDATFLKNLKGIGVRTAQKIIASLKGKMGQFLDTPSENVAERPEVSLEGPVIDVLINQLGYSFSESKKMIAEVLARNEDIRTSEQLFEEVFRHSDGR